MYNSKLHWTHFYFLGSTTTGCISISAYASLVGIPIEIKSSAIGLKIRAITEAIKKYKSIIKKKNKTHDRIVLLAKSNLNCIEVLIYIISRFSYLSWWICFNRNNLKKHNEIKEEIKHLNT